MAKPSISVPDDLLEDFDKSITRRKAMEDEPADVDRSQVIREFMREYVEETDDMWGNSLASSPMMAD